MCRRYAATTDADCLTRLFVVDERHVGDLTPSYNVAPTDDVPGVVEHGPRRHLVLLERVTDVTRSGPDHHRR